MSTSAVGDAAVAERSLTPSAVGYQFIIMIGASILTFFVFSVIRPRHKRIYQPKVKYHVGDKPPPKISGSFFGWLPPIIHTKESELLDKIGLDAVAFLRFMHLLRTLFIGISILTCGILIPINVLYNRKPGNVEEWKRDVLSVTTIRDVKGKSLLAHIAVTYAITLLVVVVVYLHWREMLKLRKAWFKSSAHMDTFYARTLCVLHVPRSLKSDEGITKLLDGVKMPYPATSVHIGRKVGRLPELVDYHNNTVRELETILVKHLKGGKVGKTRPTVRVGGCCGFGGTRHDAIEYYTVKLRRTEAAVIDYRNQTDTRKPEMYGFASLAAVPYAHIAARKLAGKRPKGATITLSPNPKDIIWENMNMAESALARRKLLGFIWLCLACFLSLIPTFFVSALANLDAVALFIHTPFLRDWLQNSETSFAIIQGVVPPAIAAFLGFFLPKIMRWLSQYMGALTHARLDRAVVARFFAFNVISQLIIFTLIGVAFRSVSQVIVLIGARASFKEILHSLDKLPDTINETYINQSSFWLQYFAFRFFGALIFDLGQAVNLVWLSFKTHIFGRTPRDIRDWTQPQPFEYSILYTNQLFLAAVALLFAPLAPLVALAATIVFYLSSWVYKYNLMYVFITRVESGGRLWNVVINRLLFCVIMMQALMILTIGLQDRFKSLQWVATIPPMVIIIVFKWVLTYKFDNAFRYYVPTPEELKSTKIHSSQGDIKGHRLENRFGHPALHAELFTPMLHADMMPLLRQVYGGAVTEDKSTTKLKEYGGQRMPTQMIDGLKIAAVARHELEYDPAMYQRNMAANAEWDRRSTMTSSTLLGSSAYSPSMMSSIPTARPPIGQTPSEYSYNSYGSPQPLLDNRSNYFDNRSSQHMSISPGMPSPMAQYRVEPIQESEFDQQYPPSHSRVGSQYDQVPYNEQQQPYTGPPVQRHSGMDYPYFPGPQ